MKFKKHILIFIQAISIMFLSLQVMAKQTEPLKIGDKVPDIKFTMLNYKKPTVRLSDFKGKLVILDFWATWCSVCIDKFPKLDSLQKKFPDKIQIILVNSIGAGDNKQKVSDFFSKRKNTNGMPYQLAIAIEDNIAKLLFPHKAVPHYAWIAPDGKVKAITSSDEVTVDNIEKILKNDKAISMPLKEDYFPNQLLNLPVGKILIDDNFPAYKLFRKGKIGNIRTVNYSRLQRVGKITDYTYNERGRTMINLPILDMYRQTLVYNRKFFEQYTDKKLILDVKDSSGLFFTAAGFDWNLCSKTSHVFDSDRNVWEKENLYSYDIVVPANETDSLYTYMINDLNHYSNFYGRIEKRKVKCLALVRTSTIDKIRTKGGVSEYKLYMDFTKRYVQNTPVSRLRLWLDLLEAIRLPVIDETAYTGNIDIDLSVDFNNFAALRKAFNAYDLDLVEVDREIDMFVISGKQKSNTTKSK